MTDIVSLFCSVDDFWIEFEPEWKAMLLQEGNHEVIDRNRYTMVHQDQTIMLPKIVNPMGNGQNFFVIIAGFFH